MEEEETNYIAQAKPTSNRAMKLGSKSKDVESFVDQLKNEGEVVQTLNKSAPTIGKSPPSLENIDE